MWELWRAFLVLTLIWWMFAAYAWLTNSTRPGIFMRFVMIAAMGGFLVMALAVPKVFGADGFTFALAYLFVIVLHAVAFVVTGGRQAFRGILEVGPLQPRSGSVGARCRHHRYEMGMGALPGGGSVDSLQRPCSVASGASRCARIISRSVTVWYC